MNIPVRSIFEWFLAVLLAIGGLACVLFGCSRSIIYFIIGLLFCVIACYPLLVLIGIHRHKMKSQNARIVGDDLLVDEEIIIIDQIDKLLIREYHLGEELYLTRRGFAPASLIQDKGSDLFAWAQRHSVPICIEGKNLFDLRRARYHSKNEMID
jgi:hypothetical protein